MNRARKWKAVLLVPLIFGGGCVVSNLDNAFDPANPTGLFLGQQLGVLGSSPGSGSTALDCDQIAGTLTATQNYSAAGSYSYPVSAAAVKLEITVIGGGGGGGEYDIMNDLVPGGGCGTYCSVDGKPEEPLKSSWERQSLLQRLEAAEVRIVPDRIQSMHRPLPGQVEQEEARMD